VVIHNRDTTAQHCWLRLVQETIMHDFLLRNITEVDPGRTGTEAEGH